MSVELSRDDLRTERALERVRTEVFRMEKSEDIVTVVRIIWDALAALGYDLVRASITVIDEEKDFWGTYQVMSADWMGILSHSLEPPDDDLRVGVSEFAISVGGGPYREALLEAWREHQVFRYELTSREDKEHAARFVARLFQPVSWHDIPDAYYLYVPSRYGFVGVATGGRGEHDFDEDDIRLFERFGDAFSDGYQRFVDLRAREIQASVDRLRAEVTAMRSSRDIVTVVTALSRQLTELGVAFDTCSISVVDDVDELVRVYALVSSRLVGITDVAYEDPSVLERLSQLNHPVAVAGLVDNLDFIFMVEPAADSPVLEDREREPRVERRSDDDAAKLLERWRRLFTATTSTIEHVPRAAIRVPFTHGSIAVTQMSQSAFTTKDVDLVAAFADALSLGFTRLDDFQKLESKNRQLAIERAVASVQSAVQSMESSADIVRVITLLSNELEGLGMETISCAISLKDDKKQAMQSFATLPLSLEAFGMEGLEVAFGPDTAEELDEAVEPVVITGIPEAGPKSVTHVRIPYDVYYERHGHASETTIVDRGDREIEHFRKSFEKTWRVATWPEHLNLRSSIRAPFKGGMITVNHFRAKNFTEAQAAVLTRFARAFSLGYARYLDFRRLEGQNRELEIERAVESVQNAVHRMKSSADIVRVITLLTNELEALGLSFTACAISLDDESGVFLRSYAMLNRDLLGIAKREVPFSPKTMAEIEHEPGPILISGIPEAGERVVACVTIPSEVFYDRHERVERTTIVTRTDEEIERILPSMLKTWNVREWPKEYHLRSMIRAPFTGGVIAVNDQRPDYFTREDADLIDRFARAFSLGYARYLDFRTLEEQNRELETERAVETVQIAVQAMKSSADIVTVIALLFRELGTLGIDFSACVISLFDEDEGKVRSFNMFGGTHKLLRPEFRVAFSEDTIAQVENEEGPIIISDIPGAEHRTVNCVTTTLDDYFSRQPRSTKTAIISRSEEELAKLVPLWKTLYKTADWPEELYFRSSVRAPFAGGTIVLHGFRPNQFDQRDAQVAERFAEAFSLGLTRHRDFRQLEEQNKVLEAANRLKSEFLANMSHEIRTPMNAVINFSALILDGTYGDISEDLRDAVEEIDRNGEALLALINDILDLAKIDAGAMKLQLDRCRPEQCVDDAIATLHYEAKEKGLELRQVVAENLPEIVADERRITQHVLINLIKNAVKFTSTGSVEAGAQTKENVVAFWVKDTGPGIPESEREAIFESFRQVDGSLTREVEGSGLGLTIARKFVEMHGGRIWVDSELGAGSTFHFTIPVDGG